MDGGAAGLLSNRRCLGAALLVLASGCATVATRQEAVPRLWAGLERDEHNVGFRTSGEISVWYPASSGGEALRFRDYAAALDELETSLHAKHFSDQAIVDLFETRMYARRDALAIEGKFAVVMIVTREGESAADHAVLAEFLASHGHVVAVAPPNANVDAIRPTVFLHNVDAPTWTFLSSPTQARLAAEKVLQFIQSHS